MTTDSLRVEEPQLTVQAPPSASSLRRLLSLLLIATIFAACGLVALLVSGNLLLPFEDTISLEGKMGSKADYFADAEVQRLLMKHHIQVHVTQMGSRDAATSDLNGYDFAFLSGSPAVQLILDRRATEHKYASPPIRPFTSPIVLATYRGYAETLRDKGIASPQGDPRQANPLYYNLNKFLNFIQQGKTWNDLNIQNHRNKHGEKMFNGNLLSVQATDACLTNSGATYLALVSYALLNNNRAPNEKSVGEIANRVKPILQGQNLSVVSMSETYFSESGSKQAPIVVIYEHQYLAYQIRNVQSGGPDLDRVLLYPSSNFQTSPGFIGLNQQGERLGRLITEDPELQQRASELGFRATRPIGNLESGPLSQFLRQQGIPAPSTEGNDTRAILPDLPVLERMIKVVGECKDNQAAGQRVPFSREFAAFDSGLWWRAWLWPWAIVWGLTIVAALATVSLLVTYLSKVIKRPAQRQIHGISFYLQEKSVMSLYQQGYNTALERQVRKERRRSNNQSIEVTVGPGKLGVDRKGDTDIFSEWIEKKEPITVIGRIMDILEDSDDIVHVDLVKQRIMQNRSLTKSVGWSDGPEKTQRRSVRLHEIDAFVLLKGRFQKTSQTKTETIFLAPYGDPHDPDHVPRVRVKCVTSGLRDAVPDDRFQAQCLGKVENWNPRSGELVIDAVAIFK